MMPQVLRKPPTAEPDSTRKHSENLPDPSKVIGTVEVLAGLVTFAALLSDMNRHQLPTRENFDHLASMLAMYLLCVATITDGLIRIQNAARGRVDALPIFNFSLFRRAETPKIAAPDASPDVAPKEDGGQLRLS